jgi:hypothetical protein
MSLFTDLITVIFYFFTRIANRIFTSINDPATGEKLTEKNKKFEIRKVLQLPWIFWCILAFSLLETSTAVVFTQNATELAEQRFGTDSITAGWYSATLQYAGMLCVAPCCALLTSKGFFVVPILGVVIDLSGNRISPSKSFYVHIVHAQLS